LIFTFIPLTCFSINEKKCLVALKKVLHMYILYVLNL
jgi:hypothetical protein